MFRVYQKSKSHADFQHYAVQRNLTKSLIRDSHYKYEMSVIQDAKNNPKHLHSYIKKRQKIVHSIGPLEKSDGTQTKDARECAVTLGEYFKSVYTIEDTVDIPLFSKRINQKLPDVVVTEDIVLEKLSKLDVRKAQGPDSISPWILKYCREALCQPLTTIYQQSLESGNLPKDWTDANVTPIFKKGQQNSACNYRPISLTSHVCKMLESILRDKISVFLTQHNVITTHQHGFIQGRSCLSNLLRSLEDWTFSLDNGHGVDVVFLDFQKAFDTVPHHRLLHKLGAYGVNNQVLRWLKNFLCFRRQRVLLDGESSDWYDVVSGVPQGSVLGPLLFIIYVNDIPDHVNCASQMFADDLKIYRTIHDLNDSLMLQNDLNILAAWSKDWLLKFNIAKCLVMHLGPNTKQLYSVGSSEHLSSVNETRDLGIWMDSALKFLMQCSKAANKAMQALGRIKRTFKYITPQSFLILYKTYIRPHLEYCTPAWSPFLAKDIDIIEKVQHRSTKLVVALADLPYEDRLRHLDLYSLYCRRQRADLITIYKLLHNKIQIDSSYFFTLNTFTTTRGHDYKLYKTQTRLHLRQNFFSNRTVTLWNNLPNYIVAANDINQFKNTLDNYWHINRYGHIQRP